MGDQQPLNASSIRQVRSAAGARVGIVGATGLVGQMMLQLLQARGFPVADLRLFASARPSTKNCVAKNK